MERGKTTFLKLVVAIIGLVVLMICLSWLPSLARQAAELNPEFAYLRYPVLAGIYATTIPFYLALYHSLRLLGCIEGSDPFSKVALASLKHIQDSAVAIAMLYALGILFLGIQAALHPGIALAGLAIILASAVIAVFAAVLQQLLSKALDIKSENDLTI